MHSATNFNEGFRIVREGVLPWSENLEQRRRAGSAIARTDSESTLAGDSAPSRPPPPPPPPPPPDALLAKKRSSCSCGSRRLRAGAVETGLRHVEAKLYSAELEEAASDERTEAARERLRRAAQVLEAQVLFSQSLDLKNRALARLTQVTDSFTCKETLTSSALNRILDKIPWDVDGQSERLADVADAAGAAVETPDRLHQLLDDFREKKKDFQAATDKLDQYLRTSNMFAAGKRQEFESQYDSMRGTYDRSRKMVEKELSKLIEERRAVVEQCFSKLAPLQERMLEQDKQFLALTKEVSKSFQEPRKQARRCSRDRNSKQNPRN